MSHDIGYLVDKAMNDSLFLKKCKKGNDSIEEAKNDLPGRIWGSFKTQRLGSET